MFENKNVLVLSVGGSPQPLTTCIEEIKPDIVYFIHSKESLKSIEEVMDKVSFEFEYVLKLIKNPESLQDSFNGAREVLLELNKKEYNIHIDFTGGTKPMVGGLILASTGDKYVDSCEYSYVGSVSMEGNESNINSRDKGGVGIVKDGFECVKPQKDPYETYAILEFNRGKNFFNNYQFGAAKNNFSEAESKLELVDVKNLANFYNILVSFYDTWDKFEFKIGKNILPFHLKKFIIDKIESDEYLKYYFEDEEDEFYNQLKNNLKFLDLKISFHDKKFNQNIYYYLPDLLNNTYRRIEERKFDDAVARMYRIVELVAQLKLCEENLINSKNLRDNKVFTIDKVEFRKKFNFSFQEKVRSWRPKDFKSKKSSFKLARDNSYMLLEELDVPLAIDYMNDTELKNKVGQRNNSILAHGLKAIDEETALILFDRVMNYSKKLCPNIEKYMELAKFPKFEN